MTADAGSADAASSAWGGPDAAEWIEAAEVAQRHAGHILATLERVDADTLNALAGAFKLAGFPFDPFLRLAVSGLAIDRENGHGASWLTLENMSGGLRSMTLAAGDDLVERLAEAPQAFWAAIREALVEIGATLREPVPA